MKNILATLAQSGQPLRPAPVLLAVALLASAGWGTWATCQLLNLDRREVVTVQLARIMGDFVEAEARAGRPPEETKARVEAYLKAVDAAVRELGQDGRTVLVAEAVVAGVAPDITEQVRAAVARKLAVAPDAPR